MSDNSDRISALPDSVLCHILSFLPTKLAVSTSVLSKRWTPLWLSLSALSFDCDSNSEDYVADYENYSSFVRFVYRVMLSQDPTQPIKRFSLRCLSSLCEPSDVKTWVNAALQRRLEHLDLSFSVDTKFPFRILSSTTLVVMKLSGISVNDVSTVGFPALKTLHLRQVIFPERRCLAELLSVCPILEDLRTRKVGVEEFPFGEFVSVPPTLLRADILNGSACIPWKGFHHVEFISTDAIMKVYPYHDDIPMFQNLTHMELLLKFYDWDWLVEMLKHCPKLQIFVIKKMKSDQIEENWAYPEVVPECLSSHLRTCSLRNFRGREDELQFARYIMQNARLIRKITICSTSDSTPQKKLEMLQKLSLCPRISVKCELSFK